MSVKEATPFANTVMMYKTVHLVNIRFATVCRPRNINLSCLVTCMIPPWAQISGNITCILSHCLRLSVYLIVILVVCCHVTVHGPWRIILSELCAFITESKCVVCLYTMSCTIVHRGRKSTPSVFKPSIDVG